MSLAHLWRWLTGHEPSYRHRSGPHPIIMSSDTRPAEDEWERARRYEREDQLAQEYEARVQRIEEEFNMSVSRREDDSQ